MKPFEAVKDAGAGGLAATTSSGAAENVAATAMMTAVQGGQSFSDAATVAGVTRTSLAAADARAAVGSGVPATLQRVLFGLKQGEATMVETPDGFIVALLAEIASPTQPPTQPATSRCKTAVARSIGSDVGAVFAEALRAARQPADQPA